MLDKRRLGERSRVKDGAGDVMDEEGGLICLGMIVMHHFGCSAFLSIYLILSIT